MAAPFNRILSKCEKAGKLWLDSKSIGTERIYTGKNSTNKDGQCVIVYAERAIVKTFGSGNFHVRLKISVKTPMADDGAEDSHDALAAAAFDPFLVALNDSNTLCADLSGQVNDFTVFNVSQDQDSAFEAGVSEDCWQDTMSLMVYCCGADIS